MALYINYFCCLSTSKLQKYNGGNNYANTLINMILKKYSTQVVLLCPKKFDSQCFWEKQQWNRDLIQCVQLAEEELVLYPYETNSIFFIPVLYKMSDFKLGIKLKKARPDLKLCATIHDLRMLDYVQDRTEKYYMSGIKRIIFPIYHFVYEGVKTRFMDVITIKKCIANLDEIYTVSNFAMQNILALEKHANVRWYYQFSPQSSKNYNTQPEDYILFVSGGRRLKNFNHALSGFVMFKQNNPLSKLKLLVTGIDNERFDSISQIPYLDSTIVQESVIHYDYVDSKALSTLYSNCKFLIYTSKMEGFGLPIIEAASYGKTAIASNRTAIPEVIGSAIRYVCPTDDRAIADAISYFCDDNNLKKYEDRIKKSLPLIQERMVIEQENLINDLLEYDQNDNH